MTTIRIRAGGTAPVARPAARREPSPARRILLLCGILAAPMYVATDFLGGLLYPGYSFTSQAVSELMAAGAPSEPLVDPLFILYGVLMLAFGAGVLREASSTNRPLRVTGALLMAYAAIGFAGPTLFEMQRRGTGSLRTDAPHLALTAALALLTLLAIGFGAFALGPRFRVYSLATLVLVIALGALSARYGARLAAGGPTPGLGIAERVMIYASLVWMAVLANALLRRLRPGGAGRSPTSRVHGRVAPGFEEVRAEFERNFARRGEIGAAVAAYWRGEKVVDLWGGYRTPDRDSPWNEDTMVVVMSCTKGLAAMTLAVANARGWLDYDAPVVRYWPEFGQQGKAEVTVRQLLAHEAGLVLLDEPFPVARMRNLDDVARLLARQKPAWKPGTRHGYHAMTLGLYMQEIIRHVDPMHRTLGRFFQEEIARPLGLDFYIGLPAEIPGERLARFAPLTRWGALAALRTTPNHIIGKVLWPWSMLRRSLAIPTGLDFNERRCLAVELPAGNGVGTARAMARAYSAFAEGGAELGISPETMDRVTAPPPSPAQKDAVLGVPSHFSLGFLRPGPGVQFGSSEHAFGAPGAGGSFAFADPDAHVGYAYVMNRLGFYLYDDPREKALRDALYRAVARQTGVRPQAGDATPAETEALVAAHH